MATRARLVFTAGGTMLEPSTRATKRWVGETKNSPSVNGMSHREIEWVPRLLSTWTTRMSQRAKPKATTTHDSWTEARSSGSSRIQVAKKAPATTAMLTH